MRKRREERRERREERASLKNITTHRSPQTWAPVSCDVFQAAVFSSLCVFNVLRLSIPPRCEGMCSTAAAAAAAAAQTGSRSQPQDLRLHPPPPSSSCRSSSRGRGRQASTYHQRDDTRVEKNCSSSQDKAFFCSLVDSEHGARRLE